MGVASLRQQSTEASPILGTLTEPFRQPSMNLLVSDPPLPAPQRVPGGGACSHPPWKSAAQPVCRTRRAAARAAGVVPRDTFTHVLTASCRPWPQITWFDISKANSLEVAEWVDDDGHVGYAWIMGSRRHPRLPAPLQVMLRL